MKRRQWTSQEKLKIILEGLSGQIERPEPINKTSVHGRRRTSSSFAVSTGVTGVDTDQREHNRRPENRILSAG
jgi:hypothetical protein